jgi:alkylhydroperoxidase family enzyme
MGVFPSGVLPDAKDQSRSRPRGPDQYPLDGNASPVDRHVCHPRTTQAAAEHEETPMARLPLIDPESTSGDVRASFDRMPVKLNIFRMLAHADTNFIPAMRLGNAILHKQKLSHVHRELLILQAAQREGGAYEWRQHVPIALGLGVTQAQIDAVERGDYTDASLGEAERALLAFGCESIDNVRVGEATFTAAKRHFSPQEIVEAVVTIGFYMMMARLTEATEVDLDPAAGMAVYDGGRKR